MRNTTLAITVVLLCFAAITATQAQTTESKRESETELSLGQLEEIAMCHHAIMAAHHDGIALHQNPYYRYIVNAPQGRSSNVYPIPERCKNLETAWILNYTNLSAGGKTLQDKTMRETVGMTISDIATDAQFLTVVVNKMAFEGSQAVMFENRDKDIPQ